MENLLIVFVAIVACGVVEDMVKVYCPENRVSAFLYVVLIAIISSLCVWQLINYVHGILK